MRFLDGILICGPKHSEPLLLFKSVAALEEVTEDRIRADWWQLPQIAGKDNVYTLGSTTSENDTTLPRT